MYITEYIVVCIQYMVIMIEDVVHIAQPWGKLSLTVSPLNSNTKTIDMDKSAEEEMGNLRGNIASIASKSACLLQLQMDYSTRYVVIFHYCFFSAREVSGDGQKI